jgi:hypothetical protein
MVTYEVLGQTCEDSMAKLRSDTSSQKLACWPVYLLSGCHLLLQDFFAVLDHVVEDVLDESEAPPTETPSSARGRRNKKPSSDGPEVDEAATQQAQLEAAEALAIQVAYSLGNDVSCVTDSEDACLGVVIMILVQWRRLLEKVLRRMTY